MRHLPNVLTLLNLFSGCLAVVFIFGEEQQAALIAITCSLVFDLLDGLTARLLKVASPLGKELDSLADVVSFGFVPGVIFYHLLQKAFITAPDPLLSSLGVTGFFFTLFAALRLAIFNTDEDQEKTFRGLPTPAAAIFTAGMYAFVEWDCATCEETLMYPLFLLLSLFLLCGLMISPLRMFSFKSLSESFKESWLQWLYVLMTIILIVLFQWSAGAPAIVLYILLSLVFQRKEEDEGQR